MHLIILVFLLGTAVNVANTHPHSKDDVRSAIVKQFTHPIIEPFDASKLNK